MNGSALRILKTVAKGGEVSLSAATEMAEKIHGNHIDQYPLALLLEEGFLGMTINYDPPDGAEEMREFGVARTLHMFNLPKDSNGSVSYLGITTSGGLDPKTEKVFIKAKGALYLDVNSQRLWDRIWTFAGGFGAGILVAVVGAWVKQALRLP
jgi:hypothetical protein